MTELLTLDDIAGQMQMRREHVRDKIVKRPDFPRPAFALSQKGRRWASSDVQGWIESQREANLR
jgi:predicted DNA-binding transcriptional regulator AlpA